MQKDHGLRNLVLIWAAWFAILYGFQWLVTTRLDIDRPDYAVFWSAGETGRSSNRGKVYLIEPFLNRQVAWDSEYYLGIAVGGYDDPDAGRSKDPATGVDWPRNYSFFPAYPFFMRAFMLPLGLLGMNPVAAAALAGVIVALLGTLAGMLALVDLTRGYLDENDRLRMVFYMLVFPSAFFFAQVYTEGLFIGLAFWSLALARRGRWFWAGILAFISAWTRAHGGLLFIPLGMLWLRNFNWVDLRENFSFRRILQGLCALLPLAGYLAWRFSTLGAGWAALQSFYFGRGVLTLGSSIDSWIQGFMYAASKGPAMVYMGLEVVSVLAALIACFVLYRQDPEVAAFSLAVVIFSALSGSAQSQARYILAAPALFIVLSRLGRSAVFDRAWTIASLLLMGMSVMLYSFDMWVG